MLTLIQAKELYSEDFIDLVYSHFEQLSNNYRMSIFLLIQENFAINEISEILGLPEALIRTKIYSGLNLIKNALQREGVTVSLDVIWNILEIIEKIKTPDYVGDLTYFQSIYDKHSSLNESFKLLASPLSNSVFQTNL